RQRRPLQRRDRGARDAGRRPRLLLARCRALGSRRRGARRVSRQRRRRAPRPGGGSGRRRRRRRRGDGRRSAGADGARRPGPRGGLRVSRVLLVTQTARGYGEFRRPWVRALYRRYAARYRRVVTTAARRPAAEGASGVMLAARHFVNAATLPAGLDLRWDGAEP